MVGVRTYDENKSEQIATETNNQWNILLLSQNAHVNQRIAELPSAFLVNSTASSRATGNMVKLVAPMRAIMANNGPVLCGLAI